MERWFNTGEVEMRTDKNTREKRKAENLCNWGVKRYFSVGKVNVAKTDKKGGRILFLQLSPQPVQFVVSISLWKLKDCYVALNCASFCVNQRTSDRVKFTGVVNFS